MRHTGLTGKGVARNRRGHLRGERRGPSRGGGCWKSGCHAAAQQSRKSEHNGVITLADVAVFMTTWTQGNGENEECWLPWSSLVSALTSQVPFCVKTCAWCHLCYALESSPALHHPPLQCHISIPHALHSELRRNASSAKAPAPGAQFTMAGEKLSGPKSQRKTAKQWMLFFSCCCNSSDLCNSFSVLTHSGVTIYAFLLFHLAQRGDFYQLCLLLV